MNILVLLHSTTGNTRLVTRYAARLLRAGGHTCDLVDIVKRRDDPIDLSGVDLLGVACPTMYFRPTFAMERYIARLPQLPVGRPAFLLGTCAGEPGDHFALLAEQLAHKGWTARAAHWVLAPSNWPTHLHFVRHLQPAASLGRLLARGPRPLRPLWALLWPEVGAPDSGDHRSLDRFVDLIVQQAAAGWPDPAPRPSQLHRPLPTFGAQGRVMRQEYVDGLLRLEIHAEKCDRCGTCVAVCPVGTITRASDDELPRIGRGCTGCYACFNRCPQGAISALGAPAGHGRYPGPSPAMRRLFQTPEPRADTGRPL